MDHCSFEPYHVPQQSRRDKLRLISQPNPLPLLPPPPPPPPSSPFHPDFPNSIKQETSNFMGFVYNSHNFILDPQNQDITTTNPFLSSLPLQLPLSVPPQTQTQTQTQHNHFRVFDQIQPPNDHDNVYRTDQVSNVSNGQGLSLSLSSKQTNNNSINHFQRIFTNNEDNNNLLLLSSRNSVPLGPFTGYASILKGSRFLRPAQLLLDELCDVGNGIYAADKFEDDVGLTDPSSDDFNTGDGLIDDTLCSTQGTNRQRKKSTLVSMLHEVYRMYKFYYQQMHAVVESFETVAGLGNAAPYANLALKAMSKDFRSLKDAITDQLQSSYNSNQNDDDLSSSLGNNSNPALYRKPIHNNSDGFMDHQPVWRPQRGLPERAVTVLRAWLFEHFLHPYPTDADKIMLAKKTCLSRSQVSNWFINARVRLWKPMVEEIHMLETRQQTQKTDCQKDQLNNNNNNHLPIATSSIDQNRLNSIQKSHQLELPSKRGRDDFDSSSIGHHQEQQQPVSVPYDNLSRLGNFLGNSTNGGGSVSLTLGLHHQNNGMALVPDQTYPTARRLGLDVNMNNNNNNNEGYMFGGFEGQNRPFIREIMGGQLLHDFVG